MVLLQKFVFVACIISLTSCEQVPYYPEPFGTINYRSTDSDGYFVEREGVFKTAAQKVVSNKSNPIVDISSISRYQKVQEYYLQEFAKMSADIVYKLDDNGKITLENVTPGVMRPVEGKEPETIYKITWSAVAANGINYVDAVCHDYLRQINRLKKNTKGLKKLTVNSGYATAEILALTLGASANPSRILGVLASVFGLGAGVFDIYEDTILFHAEFSSIYSMIDILKDQQRLQAKLVQTRAQAVQAIQDYLYICTPHALEAAVNAKIGAKIPEELVDVLGVSDFSGRSATELLKIYAENLKKFEAALKPK